MLGHVQQQTHDELMKTYQVMQAMGSSVNLHPAQVCVQSTVLQSLFFVFISWNNLKAFINFSSNGLYVFFISLDYEDVSNIETRDKHYPLTIFTVQMLL